MIRQAEADAAEVQEELRKLEREALVLGADLEKGDMSIEGGVREAIRSSRVMKRLDVEKPKKSGCYWYRFDLLRGDILPRYYDCATDAWHVAEQPNMDDVCEPPVHWLEMEPPPVVPEGRK